MESFPMHVAGEAHEPAGKDWFETDDPFLGEPWARVARGSAERCCAGSSPPSPPRAGSCPSCG